MRSIWNRATISRLVPSQIWILVTGHLSIDLRGTSALMSYRNREIFITTPQGNINNAVMRESQDLTQDGRF